MSLRHRKNRVSEIYIYDKTSLLVNYILTYDATLPSYIITFVLHYIIKRLHLGKILLKKDFISVHTSNTTVLFLYRYV